LSAPPRARPGVPCRIGVIGAGRVGPVLAARLAAAGHRVLAVTGGSRPDRVASLLPRAAVLPTAAAVAGSAPDLLLIAVPDDALPQVVAELPVIRPDQVVAHTSGAHGLAVLRPAGGQPLALHPAMTFTGDPADLARLPGISYGVTAPEQLRAFAAGLVADLGGTVEWVAEPDRPLYHAALAHGANHLVTLVAEAADRLRQAGVRDPGRLLGPLLRAALDNALRLGDAALTGPVARGDAGTVAGHLRALARAAPESLPAYRALARRTADRAVAAGRLSRSAAEPLLAVLAGPGVPAGEPAPGASTRTGRPA
jgi:predicted short-subunit dehydrogenase-like oxidoreductase (DUF2520 family)